MKDAQSCLSYFVNVPKFGYHFKAGHHGTQAQEKIISYHEEHEENEGVNLFLHYLHVLHGENLSRLKEVAQSFNE